MLTHFPASSREVEGNPGYFQLAYYDLRKREQTLKVRLPNNKRRSKKRFNIKMRNGCKVDLEKGEIEIPSSAKDEIIQSVGIAFVAATLFLLVQPRPKDSLSGRKYCFTISHKVKVFFNPAILLSLFTLCKNNSRQ